MTSNLITLPKKADNIKPKLRRSEIVEVMAQRIIAKDIEARDAEQAKLTERRNAIEAEILKLPRTKDESLDIGSRNSKYMDGVSTKLDSFQGFTVRVSVAVPAFIQRRLARLDDDESAHSKKYRWLTYTYKNRHLAVAKERARTLLGDASLSKESRVPSILADAEMVKSFDAFITKLAHIETDRKAIAI